MGFERSYLIKIPANQLRTFTISTKNLINPWFITGFSDAESSFIISIYRDEKSKLKWRVNANFSIHIHIKDIALLHAIRDTLNVGKVRKNSNTTAIFRVDNIQELQVIIDHFNQYPLISAKFSDFLLFQQCYTIIKQKRHLTQEGLEQIISLRSNLNKGLSHELSEAFPNIVPIARPVYTFNGIPDPYWVSGFVSGDSTFSVSIENSSSNRVGKRIRLIFGTCLHARDKELLIGMSNYFNNLELNVPNCNLDNDSHKFIYDSDVRITSLLQIKNYSDIVNKVIPFFNKYPVMGY